MEVEFGCVFVLCGLSVCALAKVNLDVVVGMDLMQREIS